MKYSSLFGLFFLTLNACSSLFWRSGQLPTESVKSGIAELEYTVIYLERDSWNPLNGTTIKKSYQTKLQLFPSGKKSPGLELANLASWTLPGLVAYNSKSDRLFWVQGINDDYGTFIRKLGFADSVSSKGFKDAIFFEANQQIWNLSLSSDGTKAAFIVSDMGEDLLSKNPRLGIWTVGEHQPKLSPLPIWMDAPDFKIRWNTNDSLDIQMGKSSKTWNAKSGLK